MFIFPWKQVLPDFLGLHLEQCGDYIYPKHLYLLKCLLDASYAVAYLFHIHYNITLGKQAYVV